jgi:hypothetical protein
METTLEFTKEGLSTIKRVESLYVLKNECDIVLKKINKMQTNNKLCNIKPNDAERFNYKVPAMLNDIITLIDNGELIFKDAKV